eukprot:m.206878 g.206878  ORF g.206878 m.206878 type:complete len:350 (+) comp39685_c0_seq3:388-1437(+)
MPLSKQDARRALQLLEDFLGKLDAESEPEHVEAIRNAIDVLRSGLFTSLVDIQLSYAEDVSGFDSSHTSADTQSDTFDFCHRYGISLTSLRNSTKGDIDSGIVNSTEGSPNANESKLEEDWDNLQTDPILAKAQALLEEDEGGDVVVPLNTGSSTGGAALVPFLQELTAKTSQRRSSLDQFALHSTSGEAETSFINSQSAGKYKVTGNGDVSKKEGSNEEETIKRRDSLFFMRDKGVMNRFEQSAESRHQREVSLTKGTKGLGMSIVGTATTGVFVSALVEGGLAESDGHLKRGDQIVSINGVTMDNKSYTDAASIIKEIPVGGSCDFVLTSNPTVFAEYERVAALRGK